MNDHFDRLAQAVGQFVARPAAFCAALAAVLLWAVTGPFVGYSETWQLVVNTSTTIVTFLLMFVLQATQTRDTQALQRKLDGLISATPADNQLQRLEERPKSEIDQAC